MYCSEREKNNFLNAIKSNNNEPLRSIFEKVNLNNFIISFIFLIATCISTIIAIILAFVSSNNEVFLLLSLILFVLSIALYDEIKQNNYKIIFLDNSLEINSLFSTNVISYKEIKSIKVKRNLTWRGEPYFIKIAINRKRISLKVNSIDIIGILYCFIKYTSKEIFIKFNSKYEKFKC